MSHTTLIQETPNQKETLLPTVSFGNFATQLCGGLQMALVSAQKDIAHTSAELMSSLTDDAIKSYNSQSTLLKDGYSQALNAADEQYQQMLFQAIGEWGSAGVSLVSAGLSMGAAKFSSAAKEMENVTNKVAQQQKIMNSLQGTAPKPASLSVAEEGDAELDDVSVAQNKTTIINNRMNKLMEEGAAHPMHLNEEEAKLFPQKPFNPDKGSYYNDKPNEEDVARGYQTKGAHYIEDLDEAAISKMSPEQRAKAIAKVDEQIRASEVRRQTLSSAFQDGTMKRQMMNEGARSILNGAFNQYVAGQHSQAAKKDEAGSSVANQGANTAGSVTQGFIGSIKGIEQQAESGMNAFGRVFDGMRG